MQKIYTVLNRVDRPEWRLCLHADNQIREKFHKLVIDRASGTPGETAADQVPAISIGTAAKMANLSVSALRKYEREGLLLYHRTATGRRLLSMADIRRIKTIRYLLSSVGLNIEGIRRILALLPCWDIRNCDQAECESCRAFYDPIGPCWMLEQTACERRGVNCRECDVYQFGAHATEQLKSILHAEAKNRENDDSDGKSVNGRIE
jgi:MerR family transcriptional regulator/heat shock protein HspR